jgi:hypothetical protein
VQIIVAESSNFIRGAVGSDNSSSSVTNRGGTGGLSNSVNKQQMVAMTEAFKKQRADLVSKLKILYAGHKEDMTGLLK